MDALPNDPDWSALPDDPQQFFELPDEFGRVDLRRKYSALIRRFKPEKHPHEFQRIRSAFEELDQQLKRLQRQSEQSKAAPDFQIRFDELPQPRAKEPSEPESGSPPQPNQSDTPPRPRDLKTPHQEHARPDEERKPFRPPETQRHERKPRVTDTPEQLEQSLRSLAHRLRNDRFYLEAWPIWDQLTELVPFERWQSLLAELSFIVDSDDYNHPPVEKTEFMIRFLRRAVWTADEKWLNAAFELLDANADLLGEPWKLETLLKLRDYCNERKYFLDGTRGRQIIDDAIRDFFTKPVHEADEAFRRHQIELAKHPELLRQTFSDGKQDMDRYWNFWRWISEEVASNLKLLKYTTTADQTALQSVFEAATDSFHKTIESIQASWKGIKREPYVPLTEHLCNLLGSLMIAVFSFIPFFFINEPIAFVLANTFVSVSEPSDVSISHVRREKIFPSPRFFLIPPVLAAACVFYVALRRGQAVLHVTAFGAFKLAEPPIELELRRNALMCYEKHLAPLLDDFVRQTGVSFAELIDLSQRELEVTAITLNQSLPFVRWIHHLMANDYALACFTLAQRFVR